MLLAPRTSRSIHVCITCSNEGCTSITCTCKYLSSCVGPFYYFIFRNTILEFDYEGLRIDLELFVPGGKSSYL